MADAPNPGPQSTGSAPPAASLLDRREAIRRVAALLGGATLVGGSGLLAACEDASRPPAGGYTPVGDFTPKEVAFLDEVAETLLPETETPGAKAAGVGPFMALMVADVYDPRDQGVFREGMARLDEACRQANGVGFTEAAPQARLALLEALDREQHAHEAARQAAGEGDAPAHSFRMMKELALLGYFTSEIGCTVARRYRETPQTWEPCVPYTSGETAWAEHA